MFIIWKSYFFPKGQNSPFMVNLEKPSCAFKRDRLVLVTVFVIRNFVIEGVACQLPSS